MQSGGETSHAISLSDSVLSTTKIELILWEEEYLRIQQTAQILIEEILTDSPFLWSGDFSQLDDEHYLIVLNSWLVYLTKMKMKRKTLWFLEIGELDKFWRYFSSKECEDRTLKILLRKALPKKPFVINFHPSEMDGMSPEDMMDYAEHLKEQILKFSITLWKVTFTSERLEALEQFIYECRAEFYLKELAILNRRYKEMQALPHLKDKKSALDAIELLREIYVQKLGFPSYVEYLEKKDDFSMQID